MRLRLLVCSVLLSAPLFPASSRAATTALVNPAIDMSGHLRVSAEAARHRETRILTEDEFIRMSREPGTIVLDARSREKFDELHLNGATHLSFPDIGIESLARTIPDRNTRILIYCNNNFFNDESAFASKIARQSLNLSTFISLYDYGYRNVWELGPRLDVRTTKLKLVSSESKKVD